MLYFHIHVSIYDLFIDLCFLYLTLDHKSSFNSQFFEIKIYTSFESWINYISVEEWLIMIGRYLAEIQLFVNLESEVQTKSKYCENHL